jgi:transcriptional regulator with XRE-family HTH domain
MGRQVINISGERVRGFRIERGLTQDDLSAKLQVAGFNCSRDVLARIESGVRQVRDYEIRALAKVLKVTPNDLIL